MKWFYNLRRRVRDIVAGAVWGAFVVVACIVVGIYGEHTENAPPAVAVVVVAIFIAAVVFTVFAAVATRREKAAARQAERQAKAEQDANERAKRINTVDPALITAPPENDDNVRITARIINGGCNLPIHTKAVGVTFDDHQQNIAASNIGDRVIIKHAPFGKFAESTDIINGRTGGRVGKIKKELALELLDEFGAGFVLDGEIVDITGGTDDAPNYGCNVKIIAVSGV